jgi:hypothetical protein
MNQYECARFLSRVKNILETGLEECAPASSESNTDAGASAEDVKSDAVATGVLSGRAR